MLILDRPPATASRSDLCLLFGTGLVGARVATAFRRRGWNRREIPTPWTDPTAFDGHLTAIESQVAAWRPHDLHLVWSAGIVGFASTDEESRSEERAFRRVLSLCSRLESRTIGLVTFHLVSSAGGLFEGQRHVDAGSHPRPMRPYGRLKLRQEELLAAVDAPLCRRVYRLSSVYGPASRRARRGLIATLLQNARAGRPTTITGRLSTLRDFVWTEDVAAYLAAACDRCSGCQDRSEFLASGKPTAIHEVLYRVAAITGKPPEICISPSSNHSPDITIAPSALPPGWSATDLQTAIARLYRGLADRV